MYSHKYIGLQTYNEIPYLNKVISAVGWGFNIKTFHEAKFDVVSGTNDDRPSALDVVGVLSVGKPWTR